MTPIIQYTPYERQGVGALRSLDSVYVEMKDPLGHWTRSLLNRWGQSWDALGLLSRASYDPDGFVLWAEGKNGDSNRVYIAYDEARRPAKTLALTPRWIEQQGVGAAPDTLRDSTAYDAWGRLSRWAPMRGSGSDGTAESYSYDRGGNLRVVGETLVIDPVTERLTSRTVGGVTTSYTYDRAGNLITRSSGGVTWAYGYDALDRLVSVRRNSVLIARYGYDVLGRRIVKRVYSSASGGTVGYTRFVYKGSHVSFETDSAGTIGLRYTWGAGTDDLVAITTASGAHYYVTTDKLGSVRSIAKRDGTWQLSQRFDPYGRIVARDTAMTYTLGAQLRYGWTGREWDAETGFSYHRARYFDPESRRWTQEDPIGFAGGMNVYAYVGGSPMESRDPSGAIPSGGGATHASRLWHAANAEAPWLEHVAGRPEEYYNLLLSVHTGWEPLEWISAVLPPRPDLSYVDGLIAAETSEGSCCYESLNYKTDDALHPRYRGAEDDPLVSLAAIGLGIVTVGPLVRPLGALGLAWYSAGNPGNGYVKLTAIGEDVDADSSSVSVVIPSTAPAVSLAPWNGAVRDHSACLASCFAKVVGHAAPAYVTLDVPRSFGLVYSSATVKPTPVVQVDVTAPSTGSAASAHVYEIRLQYLSTGAYITQLNGATSSFHERGTGTTRVSAAFDARANGIATSTVLPVKVVVIARDTMTSAFSTTSLVTTIPVAVRVGGPYGDGVWPAGVPQLVTGTGTNNSAAIIEADGSVFYYQNALGGYQIPGGTDAAFNGVRRTFKDGSYQEFSAGNLRKVVDPYGNATWLWWTGNKLDSIVDPMGKKLSLTYSGSGKLQELSDPGSRETGYIVDGSNRLTRITDPDGEYTEYSYDSNGLLTQVRGRNAATWKTTYNVMNRVASDSAPAVLLHDGTTKRPTVVYTAPELAVWQPGTAGTSAGTAKPDITGADIRATLRDPLGTEVDYEVNRFGAPIKIYEPLDRITTLTRDTANRVTYSLAPNGNTVTADYGVEYNQTTGSPDDPFVLRETENHVTDAVVTYLYNSQHKIARVWGTGVDVQQDFTYYTSFAGGGAPGALRQVKLGGSSTASSTYYYDGMGRDTAVVDAEGHKTRKVYDTATGNLKETYDALGNKTRFHFDALGRTDSVYLPTGAVTGTGYGALNQATASRNPLGYVVTTEYNKDLTVKRIVDAKNQVYKFSYNALGWPVARFDLADTTKADSTWYDAAGRPRRTKTRRGNVLGAYYDVLGRLTLQTYRRPGSSVDTMYASFAYDSVGRRVVASNWIGKDTLLYDNAGRLTEHRMRQGAELFKFTYQYDTKSRLVSRSLVQNTTPRNEAYLSRSWSSWGQLSQTTAAGVTVRMDRTGADSMPTKRVINPGTAGSWWISAVFDDDHQFVRDSFDVAALDNKFGRAIARDSLGRLTLVEGRTSLFDGDYVYRYDAAGQLVQACRKLVLNQCDSEYGYDHILDAPYSYDAAGNRTDPMANAVIGAGNRTEEFKGWTLTYDADGNVISKANGTDTWTYTWDPFNKLTEVAKNSVVQLKFMYDAFGRRVIRCFNDACSTAERLVNDGDQLVLARSGTGPITDIYGYYPGGDHPLAVQFQSGKKLVYITDPQLNATVRGLADTNRTATNPLVKDYTVGPWGEVAADTGLKTRLKMAGQQYDQEVGLYYMRARYYDPELGRFLSEDPIGIAGGLNLYAYAGNDPVNRWDPTGLDYRMTENGMCEEMADVTFYYNEHGFTGYTINDTWEKCIPGTAPGSGERGAGGGGSSTGAPQPDPCDAVPVAPPGASVAENIRIAQLVRAEAGSSRSVTAPMMVDYWFKGMVQDHGPWDYKTVNVTTYAPFGNFNYAAVGAALGYSLPLLERMGGWARARDAAVGANRTPPSALRSFFGLDSMADSDEDIAMIRAGYAYFHAGCAKASK